jgi:hypothetical protein
MELGKGRQQPRTLRQQPHGTRVRKAATPYLEAAVAVAAKDDGVVWLHRGEHCSMAMLTQAAATAATACTPRTSGIVGVGELVCGGIERYLRGSRGTAPRIWCWGAGGSVLEGLDTLGARERFEDDGHIVVCLGLECRGA